MAKNARGSGTIRKKTVTRNGKNYTYWEARVTTGRDPGTGRQIQRSFTGKTQKEVREKMQAAALAVSQGSYIEPKRLTAGQWLDIWAAEYLGGVKPSTAYIYTANIRNHIKPALGAVQLDDLRPHMIQRFVNGLALAPSSVRLAYKVLYQALEKAVSLRYLPDNPAKECRLPRQRQEEIQPLDDRQAAALLRAAQGSSIEQLLRLALFTGLRISELAGLTWSSVDFGESRITVDKQLSAFPRQTGLFTSPKNGKSRVICAAASAMQALRAQRRNQLEMQLLAGPLWQNPHGLVFTNELGAPLGKGAIDRAFRSLLPAAGLPGIHFHILRHTFAVNSLRAGDDIKTLQGNLGHSSAAFTLDRYGHFTDRMKQDSARRMEGFIQAALNL